MTSAERAKSLRQSRARVAAQNAPFFDRPPSQEFGGGVCGSAATLARNAHGSGTQEKQAGSSAGFSRHAAPPRDASRCAEVGPSKTVWWNDDFDCVSCGVSTRQWSVARPGRGVCLCSRCVFLPGAMDKLSGALPETPAAVEPSAGVNSFQPVEALPSARREHSGDFVSDSVFSYDN